MATRVLACLLQGPVILLDVLLLGSLLGLAGLVVHLHMGNAFIVQCTQWHIDQRSQQSDNHGLLMLEANKVTARAY
jgi:hypothetical protein